MAVVQASGDRRWRIILKHLCLLVRSRRKADSIPQLRQHFRCKTKASAEIYPTPPIRPYTQRVAASGEQLDPCSNQFRSDAVERDASPKLFGAKAGGSPSDQRPGAHRGMLANATSRTPPAHRAKGVKDLHVPGRRSSTATERVQCAAVLSNQRRFLETTSAPCPRSVLSLSPTAQTGGTCACPGAKKKPPGVSPAVGGIIGRKRPIGRERDRETPQRGKSISHCSNLQGEPGVTFL